MGESEHEIVVMRPKGLWSILLAGMLAVTLILSVTANTAALAQTVDADVILAGGTIYDGTGSEGAIGDLALKGGKIAAVGEFETAGAARTIDCTGLVVAPGFIDLHTHSDRPITKPKTRNNLNYLTQGCTTVVTGNCGGGPVDVGELLEQVDQDGAGTNIVHLVPHGAVRHQMMKNNDRAPTPDELEQMRQLVDAAMREGAWGMSTGLIYVPGIFAETEELIELAKVVASHGGIYVSHIRDEGDHLLEAVEEAIRIGRQANLPVHISHFKSCGVPNWGRLGEAVALVEEARRDGVIVTADQYPYIATSTSLVDTLMRATLIPGGREKLFERMDTDPALERAVREVIAGRLNDTRKVVIASSKKYPQAVGKSLREIASEEGRDVIDLVLEIQRNGGASVVNFALSEEDARYAMTLPWVATASDGSALFPNANACPHPRNFGTFPRKIGHYALGENVLSLAQAIRSCSGLPADILGLGDRGYLRPGAHADVVVFDPKTFIDQATFEKPQQYSTGVRYLFIAGQLALEDGKPSQALHGRAIRHLPGTGPS
ncbi:MAG: D-aminoacylase [Planctomycetota bacterium]